MANGSLNKSQIIGNLGRDPETRSLNGGGLVCTLSIGTDEGYKDKSTGERVERTEWHRVEAFGKLAEIMAGYLKKGSKVYIEGRSRTDEYEKDGVKKYAHKVIADVMTMLDGKKADAGQPAASNCSAQPHAAKLGYCYANGVPLTPAEMAPYNGKQGMWPAGQNPPPYPV